MKGEISAEAERLGNAVGLRTVGYVMYSDGIPCAVAATRLACLEIIRDWLSDESSEFEQIQIARMPLSEVRKIKLYE